MRVPGTSRALGWTLAVLAGGLHAQGAGGRELAVEPVRYALDLVVDYDAEQLRGSCSVTVRNRSLAAVDHVPLLLYRLMSVSSVRGAQDAGLPFVERVVSFEDFPQLQVNAVTVSLARPLASGDTTSIEVAWGGYLLGYAETGMLYVKDRVDTAFTILRNDAFAFPLVGYPSFAVNHAAPLPSFEYVVSVTVPARLTVANGGRLVGRTVHGGAVTYVYRNILPAWRIDVAVARYGVLESGSTRVFHLAGDSAGGARVLRAVAGAMRLYTDWFGPLRGTPSFTVTEIPDGWGSQADVTGIIQTAAAFQDSTRQHEVYHEVSHQWNVPPLDRPSPRWNEGLATFLEYLTVEKLEGRATLAGQEDSTIERLREMFAAEPGYRTIPLIQYGKEQLTGLSYSVGFLLFDVLYRLAGEGEFNSIVGGFYRRYAESGASTDDFVRYAQRVAGDRLRPFFDDWVYTTKWYDQLSAGASVADFVRRYRMPR